MHFEGLLDSNPSDNNSGQTDVSGSHFKGIFFLVWEREPQKERLDFGGRIFVRRIGISEIGVDDLTVAQLKNFCRSTRAYRRRDSFLEELFSNSRGFF